MMILHHQRIFHCCWLVFFGVGISFRIRISTSPVSSLSELSGDLERDFFTFFSALFESEPFLLRFFDGVFFASSCAFKFSSLSISVSSHLIIMVHPFYFYHLEAQQQVLMNSSLQIYNIFNYCIVERRQLARRFLIVLFSFRFLFCFFFVPKFAFFRFSFFLASVFFFFCSSLIFSLSSSSSSSLISEGGSSSSAD
eukprot:UN28557